MDRLWGQSQHIPAASETLVSGLKLEVTQLNTIQTPARDGGNTRTNRDWSFTLQLLINVSFLLLIFVKRA